MTKRSKTMSCNLSIDLIERLDRLKDAMKKRNGGVTVSTSALMEVILERGMAEWEISFPAELPPSELPR